MELQEINKLIDGRIAMENPFLDQNICSCKSCIKSYLAKKENTTTVFYNMIFS
jgi:hypothetical protein